MYYSDEEHFKSFNGYEINGAWYPRVTKIVDIKAKPALYRFYAELSNFNEGERIKELSASEGTKVHEAIQSLLIGGSPLLTDDIIPSIRAFEKFQAKTNIRIDKNFVEYRIFMQQERLDSTPP